MLGTMRGSGVLGVVLAGLILAGCGGGAAQNTGTSSAAGTSAAKGTTGTAGKGTGAAPAAAKDTFVSIPYNMVAFLAPGKTGPSPGFSMFGDLDNETAPTAGPYTVNVGSQSVTFQFPSTHSTDKDSLVLPYGQVADLPVTPGQYSHLYLLEAVAGGPQPVNVVLEYSDKSGQTVPAAFADWCTVEINGSLPGGVTAAWQGKAVIGQQNGKPVSVAKNGYTGSAQGCGLYVTTVPVNASKTLTGIQIQNTLTSVPSTLTGVSSVQTAATSGRLNIIAATLQ